jgi:hypothetical protein
MATPMHEVVAEEDLLSDPHGTEVAPQGGVSVQGRSLRVNRRAALLLAVGVLGAVGIATGFILNSAVAKLRPYRMLGERLVRAFGGQESLREFARTQLPGVSAVGHLEVVRKRLAEVEDTSLLVLREDKELVSFVREKAREDFRRGELRACEGWLLSKTEAALSATMALAHPDY